MKLKILTVCFTCTYFNCNDILIIRMHAVFEPVIFEFRQDVSTVIRMWILQDLLDVFKETIK